MKLINGGDLALAVIHLIIFHSYIIEIYAKDSYSKDVTKAKSDKRKCSTLINVARFVILPKKKSNLKKSH